MRKQILLVSILLILSTTLIAAAGDVTLNLIAKDKTILMGTTQIAEYDLVITNPYSYEESFELNVRDFDWNVWSDPLSDYIGGGVDIPADSNYTVHLYFMPRGFKSSGYYNLPLTITSKVGKQSYNGVIPISIISGDVPLGEYAVGLLAHVDMPAEVNPDDSMFIEVFVDNAFPRNVSDITIKVDSEIIHLEDYFNLTPLQKKSFLFPFTVPRHQPPVLDKVTVSFVIGGEVVKEVKTQYLIKGVEDIFVSWEQEIPTFLKSENTLRFKNDGNIPATYTHLMPVNTFHRWFIRTNPGYFIVKNVNGTSLAWDLRLAPEEEKEIQIVTNYRILAYFAIFIIIVVLFWILLRSPIMLNKEAKVLEIKDGAISQLRVLIHLRNRTGKQISNVQLADRVPRLATIVKEFEIGTIPPDKIVQDARGGTLIKWHIEQMEPFEERIISYRIKSGLQVLGEFVLPSAMVKFTTKGGATLKTKSDVGRVRG